MKRPKLEAPKVCGREVLKKCFGKVVVEKQFKYPDGTIYNFLLWGGDTVPAIILPLTEDEKVVGVRQFRHGVNDFVLEIPGGVSDVDEKLEKIVQRELLNETGYEAGEIIPLGDPIWFEPSACETSFAPFLVLNCRKVSEPKFDKTEIMETILVPLQEWIEMIYQGKVVDSKTITITFLALHHLKKLL